MRGMHGAWLSDIFTGMRGRKQAQRPRIFFLHRDMIFDMLFCLELGNAGLMPDWLSSFGFFECYWVNLSSWIISPSEVFLFWKFVITSLHSHYYWPFTSYLNQCWSEHCYPTLTIGGACVKAPCGSTQPPIPQNNLKPKLSLLSIQCHTTPQPHNHLL